MEDQQFCLKWSNHHSNMVDIFGRLLTNEALCDVTLACDGFSFKAHKLVLSASSSFFQNLFLENPCTHPVIILPELKYTDMKALVDFMYNGQVNVSENQLPKLLKTAENLRIKGLSDCRLQNSSNHSDTSETSSEVPFSKIDCSDLSEQNKKSFEKETDSNSCNLEFHEPLEICSPEMNCSQNQESTTPNQKSANDQNNASANDPEVETSQQITDESELNFALDSETEMEPSRMMEQTMTTDHAFKTQSSDTKNALDEPVQSDVKDNSNIDGCANNSEVPQNEVTFNSSVSFSQKLSLSKDDKMTPESSSSDQLGFANNSSSKEDMIICKAEPNVSIPGPSTIVFETSMSQVFNTPESQSQYSQGTNKLPDHSKLHQHQAESNHDVTSYQQNIISSDVNKVATGSIHSFGDIEIMKNGAKRGRRPGSRLCVLCKHMFNSESELEKHMENHKSESHNISESKKFPDEIESGDSQIISEKNLVRLPVSCATCSCMLNTMSDAQSHLSMNPNCRTSQFKCLLCPKLFIWPATLIKHFREQHQGPGGTARVTQRLWFFCDICKKPLLSKHALCLHRSKFHGFSTQTLGSENPDNANACKRGRKQGTRVCRLCKRTFTSTDEYHQHLQDFHRNNMLFNTAVETASYVNESLSSTENESNSAQSVI